MLGRMYTLSPPLCPLKLHASTIPQEEAISQQFEPPEKTMSSSYYSGLT